MVIRSYPVYLGDQLTHTQQIWAHVPASEPNRGIMTLLPCTLNALDVANGSAEVGGTPPGDPVGSCDSVLAVVVRSQAPCSTLHSMYLFL